jgi:hypothetical protein
MTFDAREEASKHAVKFVSDFLRALVAREVEPYLKVVEEAAFVVVRSEYRADGECWADLNISRLANAIISFASLDKSQKEDGHAK